MNILITGANSGFGQLIIQDLVAAGHKVVGSMRDPSGRNAAPANNLRALGAGIVEIDVTSDASVAAGVAAAENELGQIDVLINNAGVGSHGLQENYSAADMQWLFDINVFGVQRMSRAVLPAMRARGKGLIVNVSSLLGRVTLPFFGPYNATKWALEALSENYRSELSGFGVEIALIEPGGFPTAFIDNLMKPTSPDRDAGYGDMAHAPKAAMDGFEDFLAQNPQQNPQLVSDAVVAVLAQPHGQRAFRTVIDKIGMGDAVEPMNAQAAQSTAAIYQNMGMDGMLTVKTQDHEPA